MTLTDATSHLVPAEAPLAGDLAAYAYEKIRAAIISLEFQPGEALQETALARRLGASRTPVREALRRLQGEGLIEVAPSKGMIVAQVSVQDVENAYFVIEALEGVSARLAAERRDSADAEALRDVMARFTAAEPLVLDEWITVDSAFHDVVRQMAANTKLTQTTAMVYPVIERVRHMHLREHHDAARIADQSAIHLAIGKAILEGEGERAEAMMRELFRQARIDNVRLLRQWIVPLRSSF
jgi:DNA-binding GntR family transcriptional regulator